MPTYDINIRVNAGDADAKIKNLHNQALGLDKALQFLGAIAGAKQLMELSDVFTTITNKLKVVTDGQHELNEIMTKTFDMAQANRTSWEALVKSYSRIRQATEQLGLSQKETLTITDSITKLLKVGGATTQETASVMLHLTHAFDEGRLHGRQLNLVMMESIPIQKAIAKELGITTGELREAGKAGLITGQVLARAFLHANESVTKEFADTLPTIKERFLQLKNAAEQWLGQADKGVGIAGAFGSAVGLLSEHLDALATVLLVVLAGRAIPAVIAGFNALTGAMALNPAVAIAVGIVAVGTAVVSLGSALADVTPEQAKLNEQMYQAAAATDDFSASLKRLQDQNRFFPQLFGQLKLNAFDLTMAYIQNAGALRRVMEAIATTGAQIQIAKIMAATGGEGFEGAVIRIEKTSKKINAEAEALAAHWAQVKKEAQEADEIFRDIATRQNQTFAPSMQSLLTPVERDSLSLDSQVDTFGKEQARRRQSAKDLADFTKNAFGNIKAKDKADRMSGLAGDMNGDNFIDDAEGMKAAFKDIAAEAQRSGDLTRDAWVNAFHASEDALAHFIRTGEFNFKQFTDGILDDLAKIIARQALLSAIGGVSGGGWTAAAGAAAIGAAGGTAAANGGSFRVGGMGGVDGNTVSLRASRNETVSVQRPEAGSTTAPSAGGGAVTVVNYFDPKDLTAALSTPHGQRVVNESIRLSGGYKRVMR